MIEWLGPIVSEYFAATEGNGMTFINAPEWLEHPGSVGRSIMGIPHVCDEDGAELPIGETGLIYFEQEQTPFEYHGDPEKTRASRHPFHANWSALGDIGYLDEDGYLYLTDRRAFTIISGGVNIYPAEIESCLIMHPRVTDVAVFGLPDPDMGEYAHAVVQPAEGVEGTPELAEDLLQLRQGASGPLQGAPGGRFPGRAAPPAHGQALQARAPRRIPKGHGLMVPSFRLDGKVAVITGATKGLGRAMALGFAESGADVVVASRNVDACEAVAAEIRSLGRQALAVGCHVGECSDCDDLVARTMREFGHVDVLVNNAGIAPVPPSLDGVTEALFDKTIDVNLKGPLRLTAVASNHLPNGGSIINISTLASLRPSPRTVVYAAAKAGLNVLTRASAQELGARGIRVNGVICGTFRTDSFERSMPTERDATTAGRATSPWTRG